MTRIPKKPVVGSISLSPDLAELARARSFVSEAARRAGFPASRVFDIALACSEAVANAIEHTPVKGEVEVKTFTYDDRLEAQIEGPGEFQAPDRLQGRPTRGLGLPLMAKLSDHLALYSGPRGGTLVGLTFYLDQESRPDDESLLPPRLLELFETSERLESLLDTVPGAFAIVDSDGRWQYLNAAAASLAGRSRADLLGRSVEEVRPDLVQAGLLRLLEDARQQRKPVSAELYNSSRDEWYDVRAFPLGDGVAYFRLPITERKRAENALRESERDLARAQRLGQAGSWRLNASTGELRWSPETYRIFGLDPETALTYESFLGLVHPEDRDYADRCWADALAGAPYDIEHRIVVANEIKWVRETAELEFDDKGRLRGAFGSVQDITRHKQAAAEREQLLARERAMADELEHVNDELREQAAELALKTSQAKLEAAMELADLVNWEFDVDAGIFTFNDRFYALYGTTAALEGGYQMRAEVYAQRFVHPDEQHLVAEAVNKAIQTGDPNYRAYIEHRIVRADGKIRDIAVRFGITKDRHGRTIKTLGANQDITERKRVEELAKRASEYNRSLLEAALDPVVTIGPDGRITDVNEATVAITGRPRDELIGTDFSDYFTDAGRARQGYQEVFAKGNVKDYPLTIRSRDGKLTDVLYNAAVYRDQGGEVVGVFAAARDMTAYKELGQQREIATRLQQALFDLPNQMPGIRLGHLYRSATAAAQVGGDFYDVFDAKDGKIAVLIGDVSGHGILAARTATLVKDVVNAFTHQSSRPHEVLRRTNALLVEKKLPGFVTLFLGILDTASGDLLYASAGHPDTLLRRVSGEIQHLGSSSSPLGVFSGASWRPGTAHLRSGDLLFLYTDGIIEARRKGDLFGEGRLEELLRTKRISVEALPQSILEQVLAFSSGRLADDVAMLVLALTGTIPEAEPAQGFTQGRLLV